MNILEVFKILWAGFQVLIINDKKNMCEQCINDNCDHCNES